MWVSCALWVVCGRIWATLGPPTALQPSREKNLAFGGSAGGYPVGPWGFGVGGCTPSSAYLVVCAKLRPFGAFQFLPKPPLPQPMTTTHHPTPRPAAYDL